MKRQMQSFADGFANARPFNIINQSVLLTSGIISRNRAFNSCPYKGNDYDFAAGVKEAVFGS